MQVREEQRVDLAQRHARLQQALRDAAAAVDEQVLATGLHQHAGAEAFHDRRRAAGAEQGDAEFVGRQWLRLHGRCRQRGDREQARQDALNGCSCRLLAPRWARRSRLRSTPCRMRAPPWRSGSTSPAPCAAVRSARALASLRTSMVSVMAGNGTATSSARVTPRRSKSASTRIFMSLQVDAVLVRDLVADDVGAADQRSDEGLGRAHALVGAAALDRFVDDLGQAADADVGARMRSAPAPCMRIVMVVFSRMAMVMLLRVGCRLINHANGAVPNSAPSRCTSLR